MASVEVYAHPDIMDIHVLTDGKEALNVKIIGLNNNEPKDDKKEIEFLSDAWIWKNFIWLLIGVIALCMTITISIVYRDELPIKLIKN